MKPPDHPASPDQANAGSDNLARLAIEAHPEPGGVRVRPCGEIDLATVDRIRRQLDQCVAAGHKRVVLDLRDVTFMDSTGLHLILQSDAAARTAEWELRLIQGPARIRARRRARRPALRRSAPTPYSDSAPRASRPTRRRPPDLTSPAAAHAHPLSVLSGPALPGPNWGPKLSETASSWEPRNRSSKRNRNPATGGRQG
jgi:anti-anti-sigma factor